MNHYAFLALYDIDHWMPSQAMGGAGFMIRVYPAMTEAVACSGLTQVHIDRWIEHHWQTLCKGHGYHEDSEFPELWKSSFRANWGEWGLEHINVPGNACGLDIDSCCLHAPRGGRILSPHNVDTIRQASMLLAIYTGITSTLMINQDMLARGMEPSRFR